MYPKKKTLFKSTMLVYCKTTRTATHNTPRANTNRSIIHDADKSYVGNVVKQCQSNGGCVTTRTTVTSNRYVTVFVLLP